MTKRNYTRGFIRCVTGICSNGFTLGKRHKCSDLSMLLQLPIYLKVTADYLLGLERNDTMAKLLKTKEFNSKLNNMKFD